MRYKIFLLISIFLSFISNCLAVEDLTTYTEVDGNSNIIRNSTTAYYCAGLNGSSSTIQTRNANAYVYKDFGAGYFADFEHKFTVYSYTTNQYSGPLAVWGVSNSVETFNQWSSGYIVGRHNDAAGYQNRFLISDYTLATSDLSSSFGEYSERFLTVNRTGTTLTCYIYTNSSRTTLEDTISISIGSSSYRYLYALSARDISSSGRDHCGMNYNYDIPVPTPASTGGPSILRNSIIRNSIIR